jgi:hypothetical protein
MGVCQHPIITDTSIINLTFFIPIAIAVDTELRIKRHVGTVKHYRYNYRCNNHKDNNAPVKNETPTAVRGCFLV